MDRRFALAALACLSVLAALPAVPAHAAGKPRYTSYPKGATPRAPAPVPRPEPLGDTVRVEITTEYGVIPLDLDHKRAPVTVGNFVRYVDLTRFDGIVFYRAMRLPWGACLRAPSMIPGTPIASKMTSGRPLPVRPQASNASSVAGSTTS